MFSEFKEFAMKGNVVDLAVGVIIGAAFGKIVSSLIENVITPLLLKPAIRCSTFIYDRRANSFWRCKIWFVSFGSN